MKPIKVCHLTSVHIPFDTRIFYKECMSLSQAGYDVNLIAVHDRDQIINGIKIHAVPKYNNKINRMLFTTLHVLKKALTVKSNIYHFHDPELIPVGLFLRLLGKKVIYDVHEDYPETIPMKEIFPKFIRKFSGLTIKIIEQIFARFSNAVIVVTPSIYERFIKYTKNTYAVHNYPIIKPHKFIPWNERKDDVFYIGSIAQNRGIYEMIKAIGLVQKKYSVKLVLAGSFTSDFLEREIKAQPEFVFVDYKGFIDPVEAELIKERVKIGLIVLHPEPRYQVSLPVKFFEYMAAGIPVIASDFPLWRKIVEEANCGLLVNPKKPENIADAIVSILKNPEKSETMGKCAYDWVRKNYSWENEQKTLLDLYNTLVSKTSKHS